jgi:hexosaminidase
MLDQVIALHPDVPYFHIGCDEVYYKLENEKCRSPERKFNGDFTEAFMTHVMRVADHIRKKVPKARIIVWNDMMNDLSKDIVRKYVSYF